MGQARELRRFIPFAIGCAQHRDILVPLERVVVQVDDIDRAADMRLRLVGREICRVVAREPDGPKLDHQQLVDLVFRLQAGKIFFRKRRRAFARVRQGLEIERVDHDHGGAALLEGIASLRVQFCQVFHRQGLGMLGEVRIGHRCRGDAQQAARAREVGVDGREGGHHDAILGAGRAKSMGRHGHQRLRCHAASQEYDTGKQQGSKTTFHGTLFQCRVGQALKDCN
jgi:hypothetical protein